MTCRRTAPLALLAAVALLAARPAPTRADGMTQSSNVSTQSFLLTNSGNAPIDQIPLTMSARPDALGWSVGGATNVITGDPLTIDASHSSGFDPQNFKDAPGTNTVNNDPVLGLFFGNTPLQPGGRLEFALKLSPSFQGPLALSLTPDQNGQTTPGLSIVSLAAGGASTGGSGSTVTESASAPTMNTPEPISLTLWSGLAALGLLRARAYRRAHRQAS